MTSPSKLLSLYLIKFTELISVSDSVYSCEGLSIISVFNRINTVQLVDCFEVPERETEEISNLQSPLRVCFDGEMSSEGRSDCVTVGKDRIPLEGVVTLTAFSNQMGSCLYLIRCVWEWAFQRLGLSCPHTGLEGTLSHARLYQGARQAGKFRKKKYLAAISYFLPSFLFFFLAHRHTHTESPISKGFPFAMAKNTKCLQRGSEGALDTDGLEQNDFWMQ